MNYTVDIEFYFELDRSIKVTFVDTVRFCPNDDCIKSGQVENENVKFCQSCGSKIESKEEKSFEAPSAEDFGEEHFNHDYLLISWNNDEYIWVLNILVEGTQKFEFDIDGETPLVLSDIDFKSELDIYLSDPYVKQIFNKLEEVFGKGTVTPKIGLLQDYQ